jgi:hypothetical protein
MFIVRIFVNLLILCLELGAILGIAALGFKEPLIFAGVTFVLALWLGSRLEYARLKNELNFYFERNVPRGGFFTGVVAVSEAVFKAVLAALVALLTFSGTDQGRLYWVAIIFAGCIFAGSSLLRWLANRFNITPGRWGYFRIAAPLGLMFSVALAFLPIPTTGKVAWDLLFNLAAKPSIAQGSEMLFALKQKFDELFLALLTGALGEQAALVIAVFTSVNMLTGFIIGIYAVVIAEVVRWLEDRGP